MVAAISHASTAFPELDLAHRAAAKCLRPSAQSQDALDLAAPSARTVETQTTALRAPDAVKAANAFRTASQLVSRGEIRAAGFAFDSLRRVNPGEYRAHAQYALLMEQLADAQDATGSIGRTFVSQPTAQRIEVASERLDHLRGMVQGLIGYLNCLDNPETSARIAARNGPEVVAQGRIDTAKSIVWAVTQQGALVNAMAGAVCATVTHAGIVEGLRSGQLDAAHPLIRAQLDEHFAALRWPHMGALQGELAVDGSVAATVGAWNAWRTAQCRQIHTSIADVRARLGALLPEHADALTLVDKLGD